MLETFKFTARIMKRRPLRSLLTVLQLALGVWLVALLLSLNFRTKGQFSQTQEAFADTLARVSVSQVVEHVGGRLISSTANFRLEDLRRLQESENVEKAFFYESYWEQDILVDNLAYRVSYTAAASAEFAGAVGLEILAGQFFTLADQEQNNKVVLISEVISKQLFPDRSPLGQIIDLGRFGEERREYEIIGVYKPLPATLQFFIPESHLIFPWGFGEAFFVADGERLYGEIFIKAVPGKIFAAVADAEVLLADRAVQEMKISAEYFQDSSRYFTEQIRSLTLFLGAFAFVAILISSLGILSIMLVSVVERTREIGLRRALGASKHAIVVQILNESLVFSILGSFLGLAAAFYSANPFIKILVEDLLFTQGTDLGGLHFQAALLAFLLALAVGQLFGLYPALQAVQMPPVEALREV